MIKDDFEKRLSRQTLRKIPENWKSEILRAANESGATAPQTSFGKIVLGGLRELLWPSPYAWACVLVAWLGVSFMNHQADQLAKESPTNAFPVTQEMMIAFRKQQQWVQNMLDEEFFVSALDRPKTIPPIRREPRTPLLIITS